MRPEVRVSIGWFILRRRLTVLFPLPIGHFMPNNDAPSIPCPNCQQPMQAQTFEQNYHGTVRVDLCFGCAGIWFDHQESVLLAPAAVIELFKEIHSHLNDARQPVATRL